MKLSDLDLQDQDHLKNVILKIKIRSLKQCDLADHDLILKIKIVPIFERKYVGGVYHAPPTSFESLDELGIHVPEQDCYFPFRATFEFEANFAREIFFWEQICCSRMQSISL